MPQEVIRVNEQFYILATSSLADTRTRVLKNDETFAVFDRYGDIHPVGTSEQGLFHEGTRFLSQWSLELNGGRPILLSSTVKEDNALFTVDSCNPDWSRDGEVDVARGTLHVLRAKFLWKAVYYEALRFRNFGMAPVELSFTLLFGADYADIFEVRGLERERRGRYFEPIGEPGGVTLAYEGLDGIIRRTRIACSPEPRSITSGEMQFRLRLEPKQESEYYVAVSCSTDHRQPRRKAFSAALGEATDALDRLRCRDARVSTSNEQFNEWVSRSASDLHMMVTNTPEVLYPYAGVPWFSTPFGRDGIITALEYLWVNPLIARGVLAYLARTQATEVIPEKDAEPGKIMHEARGGEMAALGEHPFQLYYGSVDSTPLFVMLAGAYHERTGDLALIESIWPNIERALSWMDSYGDSDGDGFIEYKRHSEKGLVQQGWKDSNDSVFHSDGRLADPPIALCEVQAYAYAARKAAAELAAALGHSGRAASLLREAELLRDRFEEAFWLEDLGTYALALDGRKNPCRVKASNAGHCLFAGIASPEHAWITAGTLLESDFYSGWGIRTVAAGEVRYNPMSYHNGSVWPHDNALIAAGIARYGHKDLVARILSGLFDAALAVDLHRLPELFCGFGRRSGEGPTLYPVACSPQAWAAGSAFLLIQASLGMTVDVGQRRVCFEHAHLPDSLRTMQIRNLEIGASRVDILLERHAHTVSANVVRRAGPVELVSIS